MLFLLLISYFDVCFGSNHWIVTENGRMQALLHYTDDMTYTEESKYLVSNDRNESPSRKSVQQYQMKQSHDLLKLLNQEQRMAELQQLEQKMIDEGDADLAKAPYINTSPSLSVLESCLGPHELHLLYLTYHSAINLYSFLSSFSIKEKMFTRKDFKVPVLQEPHCNRHFKLDFSMYAFEHLEPMSIANRWRLKANMLGQHAEFLPAMFEDLSLYGHFIAEQFASDDSGKGDWKMFIMATQYWRRKGDPREAIECVRCALHLTPRSFFHIPLLDLANIFFDAEYYDDAVIVLDALHSQHDALAAAYCKSGEAFAWLGNLNASILAFDACLLLDEHYPMARRQQQYVKCTAYRLNELDRMQLEPDLYESCKAAADVNLAEYEKATALQQARSHAYTMSIPEAESQNHELFYDWHMHPELAEYIYCFYNKQKLEPDSMSCRLKSDRLIFEVKRNQLHKQSFGYDINKAAYVMANVDMNSTDNSRSLNYNQKEYFEKVKKYNRNMTPFATKPEQCKYPMLQINHLYESDWDFQESDWPNVDLCKKMPSRLPTSRNQRPRLFVDSIEKGWPIAQLLSDRLLLSDKQVHPLPWSAPECQKTSTIQSFCCDNLEGVRELTKLMTTDEIYAERELLTNLLVLPGSSADSRDEIGQRIATVIKLHLAPDFISYPLAALYWRVVGNPAHASRCLNIVIADARTPGNLKALALMQLSQVVEKVTGNTEDSLTLLRMAYDLDSVEPSITQLLSHHYIEKKDLDEAENFMRATLEIDPLYTGALKTMRAIRCAKLYGYKKPDNEDTKTKICAIIYFYTCYDMMEEKCASLNIIDGFKQLEDQSIIDYATNYYCMKYNIYWLILFFDLNTHDEMLLSHRLLEKLSPNSTVSEISELDDDISMYDADTFIDDNRQELALDYDNSAYVTDDHLILDADNFNNTLYFDEEAHDYNFIDDVDQQWYSGKAENNGPSVETTEAKNVAIGSIKKLHDLRVIAGVDIERPRDLPKPSETAIKAGIEQVGIMPTDQLCRKYEKKTGFDFLNMSIPTSTYLSPNSKGFLFIKAIDNTAEIPNGFVNAKPVCPDSDVSATSFMNEVPSIPYQLNKNYAPETGLIDAFENLLESPNGKQKIDKLAARISYSMHEMAYNPNWLTTLAAALYWRTQGDAVNAYKCLKHSFEHVDEGGEEPILIALANVYFQVQLYNSALVTAHEAMKYNYPLVITDFTLANIYAALSEYETATLFFLSVLASQKTFEPARERIRLMYCKVGRRVTHPGLSHLIPK